MAGDTEPGREPDRNHNDAAGDSLFAPSPNPPPPHTRDLPLRLRPKTTTTNDSYDENQPAQQPEDGQEDDDQNDLDDQDHGIITHEPPPIQEKKKKKKKRKPASKRGQGKPTGFEDFFADAPLTPDEYAEEQELYDPKEYFVDRIMTAIARFEQTRRLVPERRDVFYKYLAYGGLTVGPNVGQGGVNPEGMDKTQIAQARSQVFASEDKRNFGTETSVYDVDFLGCMKAFCSRRVKEIYGLESKEQTDMICSTLERFMDYLLQHDVCPEFKDDVLATRAFCRQAPAELWDLSEALRRLPGEFNIACSTLFEGSYGRNFDGETWWGNENEVGHVFVGMKPEEAQQVVKFGVAGAAEEKTYLNFLAGVQGNTPSMFSVVKVQEQIGFEITRIQPPTRECTKIYTSQSSHFRPVGRVYAKRWHNPDSPPLDLTPAERDALATNPEAGPEEYVFLIEAILQSMLRVGSKVEATVRTLGCGVMFFDEVLNVYPSFDEFLANDLMVGWKKPRPVKGAIDYVSEDDDHGPEGEEAGQEDDM